MDIMQAIFSRKVTENTDTTRVYCKGMPSWERLEKARDILNENFSSYPYLAPAMDHFDIAQQIWRDYGGNEIHTTIVACRGNDVWQLNLEDRDSIIDCDEKDLEATCKEVLQRMDDRRKE